MDVTGKDIKMNFVGNKLNDLGDNRFNRMEICRHLRADLKSQFPKPWKFTVKKEHYQGITITIKNARSLPDPCPTCGRNSTRSTKPGPGPTEGPVWGCPLSAPL